MSTKDVERRAVHAVTGKIMQTSRMEEYFSVNDKTPATDGKILVYSDIAKENKHLIGEINVQIKGESVNGKKMEEEKIRYSLKVEHLRYYRAIGGAIIFVDEQTIDKKSHIYFEMLLPLDLEDILSKLEKPDQKTKSIELSKLPEDIGELEYILESFVENSKKQQSTANQGYINSEELKKLEETNRFDTVKLHLKLKDGKLPKIPSYVYGCKKDLDIQIPLTKVLVEAIRAEVDSNSVVLLNGEQFYDTVRVSNISSMKKAQEINLHFGKGIVFKMFCKDDKCGFHVEYCISGTVEERIKDLRFVIGLMEGKNLTLGDQAFNQILFVDSESTKEAFAKELQCLLEQHNELKKCLDTLHVKKEIKLDDITEKDSETLNIMVQAINDGVEVTITEKGKVSEEQKKKFLINLNLVNLKILVAREKVGKDKYILKSFYNEEFGLYPWMLGPSAMDSVECSRFVALSRWEIENLDNIDYKILVNDFKKFKPVAAYENAATERMLALLSAYDQHKDMQYLNSAIELAEWLNEENPSCVNRLNYLQGVKRSRLLYEKEIDELCQMKESVNNASSESGDEKYRMLAAINILLDSYNESLYCLKRLSASEQRFFAKYPIYNLLKKDSVDII